MGEIESDLEALIDREVDEGKLNASDAEQARTLLKANSPGELSASLTQEPAASAAEGEALTGDIRQMIAELGIPQRLKLAMFGNSVCRKLLILDPNKIVQRAVLGNPRLQISEIEEFVKNTSVSDFVLRHIAQSKTWMGHYPIRLHLVMNPKTPPDVSLKWLRYLQTNDLKTLARSKSIPQLVAVTARKRLAG